MSLRVVIVEDDNVTLRILEKGLTDAGMEVQSAQDGMSGLDLIQTTHPDVVILDMLVPKLHGLDICKRIRQSDIYKGINIVLMSAVYEYSTFRHDIEGSGADFFVNKPIDMPKLIEFL